MALERILAEKEVSRHTSVFLAEWDRPFPSCSPIGRCGEWGEHAVVSQRSCLDVRSSDPYYASTRLSTETDTRFQLVPGLGVGHRAGRAGEGFRVADLNVFELAASLLIDLCMWGFCSQMAPVALSDPTLSKQTTSGPTVPRLEYVWRSLARLRVCA